MTATLTAQIEIERADSFRVDVSLEVLPGRTTALLGPNGAGKSTIVDGLAGLIPLDDGRIRLGGSVLDEPRRGLFVPPERRNVGVMFQEYVLFPHLSAMDNVAFGLRSRGVPRATARERARGWLDRLGLAGLDERRPADLSGGQAQRVALARALVTEPRLLLLDEPLAALDVEVRSSLRRLLREHLSGFEGPRLLITHEPTDAFMLADHILVIEDGLVTQAGTADEIRLSPRTPYAASVANANLVTGVAREGVVATGRHELQIADHAISGPVLAIVRPASISVHLAEPEGSPRNTWKTVVEVVEHLGDVVRLRSGAPLPLAIEITETSAASLNLGPGTPIWLSIKATEIVVEPDD